MLPQGSQTSRRGPCESFADAVTELDAVSAMVHRVVSLLPEPHRWRKVDVDWEACTVTAMVRGWSLTMRLWSDGTWHEDMTGERIDDDRLPRYVRILGPEPPEVETLRRDITRVLVEVRHGRDSE